MRNATTPSPLCPQFAAVSPCAKPIKEPPPRQLLLVTLRPPLSHYWLHCLPDWKRGQKQEDQIQVQRTFDRRTGELNGSLSGSARFTSLLTIMKNARFSSRIGYSGRM